MASIKDAVEESLIDRISLVKYGVLGGLLYYCLQLYLNNPKNPGGFFWMVAIFTGMLLLGFLAKCTSNVRNGEDHVLPSFNVFNLLWAGLKGTIALGPLLAICLWLANLATTKTIEFMAMYGNSSIGLEIGITVLFAALFGSIVMTGYLLYAKNFKISDAYNLNMISLYSIDILISVMFFIPQLIILNLFVVGAVTYLFWIFLGIPNVFCTYFWCTAVIWNLAVAGNYLAQVDFESIGLKTED